MPILQSRQIFFFNLIPMLCEQVVGVILTDEFTIKLHVPLLCRLLPSYCYVNKTKKSRTQTLSL